MRYLLFFMTLGLAVEAQAVTKQQFNQMYGKPVRTRQDAASQDSDGMVRTPAKTTSYDAQEGEKCSSDFDCRLDQFCRKANYNLAGVCVERQN